MAGWAAWRGGRISPNGHRCLPVTVCQALFSPFDALRLSEFSQMPRRKGTVASLFIYEETDSVRPRDLSGSLSWSGAKPGLSPEQGAPRPVLA